ncbi:MAG: hypothetical protein H7X86_00045 [Gorillibacterium sp.]|nr:hypothetical protein [Gorillibacterium sp.]
MPFANVGGIPATLAGTDLELQQALKPRATDQVPWDPTGNTYTTSFKSQIVAGYSEEDKATLSKYGAETYIDLWHKSTEFPVKAWGAAWNIPKETGSELDILTTKMEEIMKKRVPQAILAKPADFDGIWDAFMKDLDKAGVQKMNQQYSELVKARVELWK